MNSIHGSESVSTSIAPNGDGGVTLFTGQNKGEVRLMKVAFSVRGSYCTSVGCQDCETQASLIEDSRPRESA